MRYELIHEIFNQCSNNQMRDVFVEEVETDNPRKWIEDRLAGKEITIEELDKSNGDIIFDVVVSGLKQRFSFTLDE